MFQTTIIGKREWKHYRYEERKKTLIFCSKNMKQKRALSWSEGALTWSEGAQYHSFRAHFLSDPPIQRHFLAFSDQNKFLSKLRGAAASDSRTHFSPKNGPARRCQSNFSIIESIEFNRIQSNDWNSIAEYNRIPIEFLHFFWIGWIALDWYSIAFD